jgi:hypothetical protein
MPEEFNQLKERIASASESNPASWVEVGQILNDVEKTSYWSVSAGSFSAWLKAEEASAFGLGHASLWRFFSCVRLYAQLRSQLTQHGTKLPPLKSVASTLSPESVELLGKLARVVSSADLARFAVGVLDGTVTRDSLRLAWQTYRPALKGKTSRGRGNDIPRLDADDADQVLQQKQAGLINELRVSSGSWVGDQRSNQFRAFVNVSMGPGETSPRFDLVLAVREDDRDAPTIHAVIIECKETKAKPETLSALSGYCDYLWVATAERLPRATALSIPSSTGILLWQDPGVTVMRRARRSSAERKGDLAQVLLGQVL